MSEGQDYSIDSARRFRQVTGMLRPHQIKGASKVRVGRHFDGGYIMVDNFKGLEAAYSLGINDDVSWDLDMAIRGARIFQYDHTIDSLPHQHPHFNWKKIGISGVADQARRMETLEALVDGNGHTGNCNLILKCDIEGSEWQMLMKTPNAILSQFSQIVMEMHWLDHLRDERASEDMRRAISNLYSSHRIVHIHANNYGKMSVVGGYPVPCVIKATWARLDMGEFSPSDESFPTPMDMPCNKAEADIYLGRFDFS